MTGEKYCRLLKNIDITMNINITQGEDDFKKFKAALKFFLGILFRKKSFVLFSDILLYGIQI